jgi:hypothetical protein
MVPAIWISAFKIRQVWQSSGDTGGQGASGRGRTAASKAETVKTVPDTPFRWVLRN